VRLFGFVTGGSGCAVSRTCDGSERKGDLMGQQSIRQEARLAALDSQSKGRRNLSSARRPDVRPDPTRGRDRLAASRLRLGPTLRHDGELSTGAGQCRHQDRVGWLDWEEDPHEIGTGPGMTTDTINQDLGNTPAAVAQLQCYFRPQ